MTDNTKAMEDAEEAMFKVINDVRLQFAEVLIHHAAKHSLAVTIAGLGLMLDQTCDLMHTKADEMEVDLLKRALEATLEKLANDPKVN